MNVVGACIGAKKKGKATVVEVEKREATQFVLAAVRVILVVPG